jgi:outer membrane receptor protein involved in Fe transport
LYFATFVFEGMRLLLLVACLLTACFVYGQGTGTVTGLIRDKKDNSELIGVNIVLKGTSLGAVTDAHGRFTIRNVRPGDYTIEISYIGYSKTQLTGIKVKAGETRTIEVEMIPTSVSIDQDIVIIGKKPLLDVDAARSGTTISQENIDLQPARQIQSIVNTQPGIVQTPAGVSIRGGRTYETGLMIDGVKVTDPLAGTGFGLDIGSNAIADVEVTTGGIGAEYGDATAGIINTRTRRGGDKLSLSVSHKRDNFGFNSTAPSCWNASITEFNASGPVPGKALQKKLRFSIALRASFSDEFYKTPANQVVSSIHGDDGGKTWAPYQDNRWSAHFNTNYNFNNGGILTFTALRSLTINQDVNMLRVFGNDLPYQPGYQYPFSRQMDNANTFTHESYMAYINWKQSLSKRHSYSVTLSRLFVKLRADANGRKWRPDNVDKEFDPYSINQYPVTYFNPGDSVAFVTPASGFYNNGGVAVLWHDHYFEEYALKLQGDLFSKNTFNKLTYGFELKMQEMQWIDIIRPWVGAPIPLANGGTSQTFRLGQQSDVWRVRPQRGGFFLTDQIKYKGLVATIGGRLEYWAPGKFIDDAVENPRSPVREEIREKYRAGSVEIGGLRYKFRFLPKVSALFPVRENQVLFFNYTHTTILPHPSYLYPGLDPYYTDRSTLANVGNPDLNPEVDISYEIGLKSQLSNNSALTLSAFFKDKYDFITATQILIPDVTGRDVMRTMRINSDYARTRGIEVGFLQRIGTWYQGQLAFTYMVTTGQSASANEKLKDLIASGSVEDTREYYLPWDCPYDFKTNHMFRLEKKGGYFGKKWLNNFNVYFETVMRSGMRYTPYKFAYKDQNTGRPMYFVNTDPDARFSGLGEYWFWADITFTRWFRLGKVSRVSLNLQITNLFNNQNTAIVNPVTGKAYEQGDDVPDSWIDPRYIDPRNNTSGPPPANPARYLAQRHIVAGVSVKF